MLLQPLLRAFTVHGGAAVIGACASLQPAYRNACINACQHQRASERLATVINYSAIAVRLQCDCNMPGRGWRCVYGHAIATVGSAADVTPDAIQYPLWHAMRVLCVTCQKICSNSAYLLDQACSCGGSSAGVHSSLRVDSKPVDLPIRVCP